MNDIYNSKSSLCLHDWQKRWDAGKIRLSIDKKGVTRCFSLNIGMYELVFTPQIITRMLAKFSDEVDYWEKK